jgi:HK97 family phage prohead protease
MKTFYDIKTVTGSVKDVDSEGRKVVNVYSEMGSKDLDNDVVDKPAFNKTIKERGPKGSNLIWHLTDHYPSLKYAVAKFSDIYAEGNQLIGVTEIPKTTWGNDVLEFYMKGHINQHSIGYRVLQSEPVNAGKPNEFRLLKEVLLYEGSAVLWGANPNTPNVSAGKSLTKDDMQSEYKKLSDQFALLIKSMKDGRFSDETFELIEMQTAQIQERMNHLFTELTKDAKEPPEGTPEPASTTQSAVVKSRQWGDIIQLVN